MATKKEKVFALFDKDLGLQDEEVKKVVPDYGYRYKLHGEWKELHSALGVVTPTPKETANTGEPTPDIPPKGKEPTLLKRAGVSITEAAFKVTPDKGHISIGHISIPYNDFGYSSIHNLLLVSATYDQVCRPTSEGGFDYGGKLGDFCADCVELFRRVFRFDKMREEEIRHAESTGVRLLSREGQGEASEREQEESES